MIGDLAAKGKRKSTTMKGPVDVKKNAKGRSFKTIWPGRDDENDTGDSETKPVTRRMTKGMRPGVGKALPSKREPAPFAERNMMKGSVKTIEKRGQRDSGGADSLAKVRGWVTGARKSYR